MGVGVLSTEKAKMKVASQVAPQRESDKVGEKSLCSIFAAASHISTFPVVFGQAGFYYY